MIRLRRFEDSDHEIVSSILHVSPEEAKRVIKEWNSCMYNGLYFEMLAVQSDNVLVGTISLYEHSHSIISLGPEIFEEYRRRGFAKAAMTEAIKMVEEKKVYRIILQQVRTTNTASIRLHESLGFERDNNVFTNRKGNEVYFYLKAVG